MLDRQPQPLARRDYVIQASRQRVWDLLASTIIQCMPVEQMQILNDTTFLAILRLKLGFFEVPFRLRVEAADISPIESISTLVTASKGIFRSSLKVTFALAPVNDDQTSVACTATEESGSKWIWLLRRQQHSFACAMFDAIRAQLERNC